VSWILICWLEEFRVIRVIDKDNLKINRLKIVIYNLYGMKRCAYDGFLNTGVFND
jgi:hypothetical protein